VWLVLDFFGCQKQCRLFSLVLFRKLSVIYPPLLVSQADAEVLAPVFLLALLEHLAFVLGFSSSRSAWQWWLCSAVPDGIAPAASPSYFEMYIYMK